MIQKIRYCNFAVTQCLRKISCMVRENLRVVGVVIASPWLCCDDVILSHDALCAIDDAQIQHQCFPY